MASQNNLNILKQGAERKPSNDQERGRFEAIAGPGGNPAEPRKVSRRQNLRRRDSLPEY